MKKITILLSTYNGEKYLDEQLNSIYMQKTDCEVELLVRDDGSKDSTLNILKNWEKKIRISYVNDNGSLGAAKSFWKLLNDAPLSDYYAFVDQDDIWDSDKLQKAVDEINNEKKPVVWFSNCRIVDKNGMVIEEKKHKKPPILTIPSQLVCGSAQGCAMVFNSLAMLFIRSQNITNVPMHDIVLMIYILSIGKIIYEEKPLFSYRVHSNNVVAKKGKKLFAKISSTFNSWFSNNSKYATSNLAKSILENSQNLESNVEKYLYDLSQSKNNIKNRFKIITSKSTESSNKRALFSYKVKVLIGII